MATSVELRDKLDRLQGELSSRRSTTHYARAAIALLAGLMIAGASGKMFWDSHSDGGDLLGAAVAAVALALVLYATVQYVRGRSALRTELSRLEELKALRRELRLDDPSSLLPTR